jgi:hypothetical protein
MAGDEVNEPAEPTEPHTIPVTTLVTTYVGLRRMLVNFEPDKSGWATLVEAMRIVRIEMRMQGYLDELEHLDD